MFRFILDFQKIGHFFSIVSLGRPPGGRGRQDECGTLGTLSTEETVTFLNSEEQWPECERWFLRSYSHGSEAAFT